MGTWLLVAVMTLSSAEAWAKRLGGGGSMGKQSSNVVQRNSAPAQQAPATPPSQAQPAPAAPAGAAAAGAAAKPQRPWGAMLGGLAAGLGLAWLASALGLGEAFAQVLLLLLLAVAVLAVIAWMRRSRVGSAARSPLAFQGAGTAASPLTPRSYQPAHVGNDASARPWEHTQFSGGGASGTGTAGTPGSLIGSALGAHAASSRSPSWGIPAGFDAEGFLRASRENFMRLQAAWDRGDIPELRALMTDDMLAEIQSQLAERELQGGASNVTEVVKLDAELLGIEDRGDEYMASVEFSGLIREDPAEGPVPFREVWNITRPKQGRGGWLVAGVQALQ
ncbi:MAG: Tim44-like domain-containing protein [Tepidimonas sp.]|uniref:Tim44 domain-containing protein n=1 Tax=Tepidimonas sp. TaxID=2002775 RepID=UPI00259E7D29|nr:Tim44-like domain-containing protein [Tepidimonas sp.]MDM7457382.1 Tim44-like domain-containing protein [Tepidimonas sp.]